MRKEGLIFGLLLMLVLGLMDLWPRYKTENSNRSVGLCLEMPVIRETSISTHRPLLSTLKELKNAGLKYVILPEETLGDFILQGSIQILEGKKILGDLASLQRIHQSLKLRYEIDVPTKKGALNLEKNEIEFKSLKNLGLGISPKDALILRENSLIGIARHSNFYGSDSNSIQETLKRSKRLGINYYLPENDQLLGFKSNLDSLVEALKELDMFYISAEFAKMQGDTSVGIKIPERTIRLHSAQIAELEKMDPQSIIERYVRAYKERNIRLLLLRPYTASSNHPLSTLTSLLSNVKNKIEQTGGKVGYAKPFDTLNRLTFNILSLLIIVFSLQFFKKIFMIPAVIGLVGIAAFQPLYIGTLLAITVPFYGYWLIKTYPSKNIWWKYGIWSLTSFIVGIGIAGLGSNLPYPLHFAPFPGVKAVQIIPILGIGIWALQDTFSIKKIWESPVQWKGAILSCIGIGILGFMLIRSGNESPTSVSGLELKFRSILDSLFYARPRTKEFLIGHPALWIGLSFMSSFNPINDRFHSLKKYISIAGIVVGTIGQVSIINTFCHFHTPLMVTFMRVLTGLVIGILIGQIGVTSLKYLLKKYA